MAAGVVLLSVSLVGAQPQPQSKCLVGKSKCVATKFGGLLKCHATAETPGKSPNPNDKGCIDKVIAKFGAGDDVKGCFGKLESKSPNDCLTNDDAPTIEAAVDACVDSFVLAVDPPPPSQSKCNAGKKKCMASKVGGILKCYQKAQTPKKPNDPNDKGCLDKVIAKFDGGADPSKGCFAKLEAKGGCDTTNDTSTVETLIDQCVQAVNASLATPVVTTSTTVVTTTTTIATTTTTSSTTTTTGPAMCGNGVREGAEECDDGNTDNNDDCVAGCHNARCGDGFFWSGVEECDDGNTSNGDGCSSTCVIEPPVCGNNRIEGDETCDDGNTLDGDSCPSNCRIAFCTPSALTQLTTVTYTKPAGVSVGSLVVFVNYPDGTVSIPGSGNDSFVRGAITNIPTGFTHTANDLNYAIREVLSPQAPGNALPATTPATIFRVNYTRCQGAPAPIVGQFTCTVEQAGTPGGMALPLSGFSCAVTIP